MTVTVVVLGNVSFFSWLLHYEVIMRFGCNCWQIKIVGWLVWAVIIVMLAHIVVVVGDGFLGLSVSRCPGRSY